MTPDKVQKGTVLGRGTIFKKWPIPKVSKLTNFCSDPGTPARSLPSFDQRECMQWSREVIKNREFMQWSRDSGQITAKFRGFWSKSRKSDQNPRNLAVIPKKWSKTTKFGSDSVRSLPNFVDFDQKPGKVIKNREFMQWSRKVIKNREFMQWSRDSGQIIAKFRGFWSKSRKSDQNPRNLAVIPKKWLKTTKFGSDSARSLPNFVDFDQKPGKVIRNREKINL